MVQASTGGSHASRSEAVPGARCSSLMRCYFSLLSITTGTWSKASAELGLDPGFGSRAAASNPAAPTINTITAYPISYPSWSRHRTVAAVTS
jgi:hypothetical protein